jgi:hypothetical protein
MFCKTPGPYFAGFGEEACGVYGGTWCPIADCSELQTCLEVEIETSNDRPAYVTYLSSAPTITDSDDADECGLTREYFGFDAYYVNDAQICEDIKQLQYSRDFSILDKFFNQGTGTSTGEDGSGGVDSGGTGEVIEVPELTLTAPGRGKNCLCAMSIETIDLNDV